MRFFQSLEPVEEKGGDAHYFTTKEKSSTRDKTATIRRRNISTVTRRTNEETVEIENANNFDLLRNKMFLNNFMRGHTRSRSQKEVISSSSEEESEELKNPMFPSL